MSLISHLKEGERRMRLRGREGMVMVVVKDREEEGKFYLKFW